MVEKNKLGMILFVVSEAVFFLLLILAYVFFHSPGGEGPAAASSLDPLQSGLFSVALLASSLTLWLAENSRKKERRAGVTVWLLGTIVLGAVFLGGQGAEYAHLLKQHITISKNLFGTTFYTLTGFHGLHVFVGLVMLAVLLWLAAAGAKHEPTGPAIAAIAIYWHFVDAVWIVIYSVVYLWRFI